MLIKKNQKSYRKEASTVMDEHLRQRENTGDKIYQYFNDSITWDELSKLLIKENMSQVKGERPRKALTKNTRENWSTRKARSYRLTQYSYQRNKKATVRWYFLTRQ